MMTEINQKKAVIGILLIILISISMQGLKKCSYQNTQEIKNEISSEKTTKTKPTKWWMPYDSISKMMDEHQPFFLGKFWAGMTEMEFLNVIRHTSNDIAMVNPKADKNASLHDSYISENNYKKSFVDRQWIIRSPSFLRVFEEIPYVFFTFQKEDNIKSNSRTLSSVSINVDSDNIEEYDSIRKLFNLKYRQFQRTRFEIEKNSYSFEAKNVSLHLSIRVCKTNEYCRILKHQKNHSYHISIDYSDKHYNNKLKVNSVKNERIIDSISSVINMQNQEEFLQKF